MGFFDEGDEPRTRVARPGRTGGARSSGGGRGARGGGLDPQTVRTRRIVAGLFAFVLAILLFVLIDGCLDRRAENALKDYNRDVGDLIRKSDEQVGAEFFGLMSGGAASAVDLEQRVNQLRVEAERHVAEAEDMDVPGDMRPAHRDLLLALDMRQAGLGKVASEVRTALAQEQGDESAAAIDQIAAQMQQFLASDVIYKARVLPLIQEELAQREIGGQRTQDTQFLPSIEWLDSGVVADRLGAEGGGNTRRTGEPAAGLHGHGLVSVTAGGTTLQPGDVSNTIPAGSNIAFEVTFANQGDNDESDVNVAVRIDADGEKISARKRVEQTKAGTNAEVAIPLTRAPPLNTPVTIEVEVGKVPGEKTTDNNRQTYTAIFRG
ncbi:MAG TPA: hypothetical protein VGW75_10405 [Solirubrobacteraceae bacterium]|jgi:hypothetical protein|nr:hypothetical protein [Solirubrobacteraceae bacterium]